MLKSYKFLLLTVCLTVSGFSIFAQGVKGVVKDAVTNQGIPGTSVVVEGRSAGTATDNNGNYTLRLPAGSYKIKISSVGYETTIVSATASGTEFTVLDVVLKERRRLVCVVRDTPYNLIHIRNMETITLAGGIICPATPSFYSKPASIEALTETVVDRVLDLAGIDIKTFRWGE